MPGKKGSKFHTVNRYGKNKRRRSSSGNREEGLENDENAAPKMSDAAEPKANDSEKTSASAKKLRAFREKEENAQTETHPESKVNLIVNVESLNGLLSSLKCVNCGGSVSLLSLFIIMIIIPSCYSLD